MHRPSITRASMNIRGADISTISIPTMAWRQQSAWVLESVRPQLPAPTGRRPAWPVKPLRLLHQTSLPHRRHRQRRRRMQRFLLHRAQLQKLDRQPLLQRHIEGTPARRQRKARVAASGEPHNMVKAPLLLAQVVRAKVQLRTKARLSTRLAGTTKRLRKKRAVKLEVQKEMNGARRSLKLNRLLHHSFA